MTAVLRSMLIAGIILAKMAWPQVNLIVGAPNTHSPIQYAASVAEVLADGSVILRESLVDPANGRGFFWFDIDYDYRQAYALDDHDGAVVLDLNTGRVVKRCQLSQTLGLGGVYEWRIIDPRLGPTFVQLRGNEKPASSVVVGLIADPVLTCADSNVTLRGDQIGGFATGGQAGVSGEASQPTFFGNLDQGVFRRKIGADWIYLPTNLGPDIMKDLSTIPFPSASIPVRNRSIEVLVVSNRTPPILDYWVGQRPTGEWMRLPIPKGQGPNIRGFGTFLAWSEAIYGEGQQMNAKTDTKVTQPRAQHAGAEEWRKTDSKFGMSTEFALNHSSTIHPGTLRIFDVKTQHRFAIQTRQSDSEVLLIEDNVVYYRSSDRLFRAEIRGDQLTVGRQIAQSELIRDAHWAFITRKSATITGEVR